MDSTEQTKELTVRDTLPVEITLRAFRVHADEFEVNLILNVAHHNERRHHALTLAGGHRGANFAVPNIMCAHEQCAGCALGHGEEN